MILVILHKVFGRLLLVTLIPHFKIEVIAFVIFVQRLDNCIFLYTYNKVT